MPKQAAIVIALRKFGLGDPQIPKALKTLEALKGQVKIEAEREKLLAQLAVLDAKLGGGGETPFRKPKAKAEKTGTRFRPSEEDIAAAAKKLTPLFKGGAEVSRKEIIGAIGSQWENNWTKVVEAHGGIKTNGKARNQARYLLK
jgi:hypothetical protein